MKSWMWIGCYLVIINVITFMAYAMDKRKARKRKWRIPEKTLLILAAVGGSIGAFLGMHILHHKTKHLKFTVGVPLLLAIQIGVMMYLCFL